ncbi:MAG: hypothetical protein ABI472_11155 [Ginsengibacter sp.]
MQLTTEKSMTINNVTQSVQRFTDVTTQMVLNNINNNLQWFNEMQNMFGLSPDQIKKDDCEACPPTCDCPPQCMLSVTRDANPGETIIVPFKVKNTLQTSKVYQVGVRPIYDDDGNALINQPVLNKTALTLQPGQSLLVEMKIYLGDEYVAGNSYSTEIVIREKDVNQNICFTLHITSHNFIPEAHPLHEQSYFTHFQDWKSHYYCDSRPTINRVVVVNPNIDVKK